MNLLSATPTREPAQIAMLRQLAEEGLRAFDTDRRDPDTGVRAMARSLRRLGPVETLLGDRDTLWREAVNLYLQSIETDSW